MSPEEDGGATSTFEPRDQRTFASGRYAVQRLLGEGAQKSVFLVRDSTLGRTCALSLIKTDLADADDLSRVRREAQTMAQLGAQPHIVTVFDMGEDEERPYVVCEYVAGGDLREELQRTGGPLPLRRAVSIAGDLLRALSVAHRRGIIHRDVKPANIWLTEDGSPKLGDFGIALAVDRSRLTMAGTVMGTAAYMAPEQASHGEATERSDLYSLGCVLYEMVSGRPPFLGTDPLAVVSQQVHAQPSPPSQHNPKVPPALDTLTLRLLAKAPEARPASAEEALAALERIEAALPAAAAQARPRRGRRFWARRRVQVAAAVAAFAVIVGAIAGALFLTGAVGGDGPSPAGAAYQELGYHLSQQPASVQFVSGDCESPDQKYVSQGQVGEVSGDLSGSESTGQLQYTIYASDRCVWSHAEGPRTFTDRDGNTLLSVGGVSVYLGSSLSQGEPGVIDARSANIYTGGTGIYEGATGHGRCLSVSAAVVEPVEGRVTTDADCTIRLALGAAADQLDPVILELGGGVPEMAVFTSTSDLLKKVYFNVLYMNTRDELQQGLSLKLSPPEGTEIIAAARGESGQPGAGERAWTLPDLKPREVGSFQFSVEFLSANTTTVPLVLEIDGEGFEEPVRSDPLTIEVAQ